MKKDKIRFAYFGRPLTEEDFQQYSPSVMNDVSPSSKVTKKYAFFPTITVINDLKTIGWIPYAVEQRQVYSSDRAKFTKHMVIFRNPSIEGVDNLIPEVILTNSHDGRNSFQFYAGVWHNIKQMSFVVSGGGDSIEEFRIKHQGYTLAEVQKVVSKVIEVIPEVYTIIKDMRNTILTPNQKLVFAVEAIKQRWKDGKEEIDMADVINPIREDERENTLWNVFQIVQEKIVNGGIKYELRTTKGGIRKQTARALVNIDQKIEVKKSIWKVATEMVNAIKEKQKKQLAHT